MTAADDWTAPADVPARVAEIRAAVAAGSTAPAASGSADGVETVPAWWALPDPDDWTAPADVPARVAELRAARTAPRRKGPA